MQNNLQSSPLLRLPLELRSKVYSNYFAGFKHRVTRHEQIESINRPPKNSAVKCITNLSKVCRVIYAEIRLCPFTRGTFIFEYSPTRSPTTSPWTRENQRLHGKMDPSPVNQRRLFGPQLSAIRTAQVKYYCIDVNHQREGLNAALRMLTGLRNLEIIIEEIPDALEGFYLLSYKGPPFPRLFTSTNWADLDERTAGHLKGVVGEGVAVSICRNGIRGIV